MIVPNNFWLFLLLLSALLIFLEIASYSNSDGATNKIILRPKVQPEKYLKTNQVTSAQKRKHILYWTPYFKAQDWQFGFGSKPFQNCPQPNCAGEKWIKYVFKPGLMFHFWNLSHLHHFEKIMLSDEQGEGWKFRRNSLPLFLFKSFGWRSYGSIKGNTWWNGCCTFTFLLFFLSPFQASTQMSLVCETLEHHLYFFVFYVKGSEAKEATEGPNVCFCIKRITGTRQAPGMEKVSQYTVMFYNFCWLQYFEFLMIRKLIVNL